MKPVWASYRDVSVHSELEHSTVVLQDVPSDMLLGSGVTSAPAPTGPSAGAANAIDRALGQ